MAQVIWYKVCMEISLENIVDVEIEASRVNSPVSSSPSIRDKTKKNAIS